MTEALPRQSYPKIHHFLPHPQRVLISSKQACVAFFIKGFFAFWASICLCFVGLCTEARNSQECQTLKVFAEIYGNSVCYILSHPSVLMIPRFNQQETQLMFRMKLDINHDRKNVTEGSVISMVQNKIAQSLN